MQPYRSPLPPIPSRRPDLRESSQEQQPPLTPVDNVSYSRHESTQHSPSARDEDPWVRIQRFGFDHRDLSLADSTILRTPDGTFFKYEKITSLPPEENLYFDPQSSEQPPRATWLQSSATHIEKRTGAPQFVYSVPPSSKPVDKGKGRGETYEQGRASSSNRSVSQHNARVRRDPTTVPRGSRADSTAPQGRYLAQQNETIIPEEDEHMDDLDSLYVEDVLKDEGAHCIAESARRRDLLESERRHSNGSAPDVMSGTDQYTRHPHRHRFVMEPDRLHSPQGKSRRVEASTTANLTSPFEGDVSTSSQAKRRVYSDPVEASTSDSRLHASQIPSTTMVLPGEYFAPQYPNGFHPPASSTSLPERVHHTLSSTDAAFNAPIYVGSDASTTSDRTSNENISPGEVLLFEGDVGRSASFQYQSQRALLRIFRHTITGELRFYSRVGNDTESVRMRYSDTELVPTYAYDMSKGNVLYLRETSKTRAGISHEHSAIYQFRTLRDLVVFQGKLLEEEVFLDISSLRFVKLVERGSSERRVDFARLQIWHEQAQGTRRDDTGSIMTAGTALSGPLRERTKPASSRLVLFLGRAEEYLCFFITDDVTLKQKGSTTLWLQATKYSGTDYFRSRTGIKCSRITPASGPAGIPLSKAHMGYEDEESFGQLKGIGLEFENENSLTSFWETWDYLMRLRRQQRLNIQGIQSDMSQRVYYGPIATSIL